MCLFMVWDLFMILLGAMNDGFFIDFVYVFFDFELENLIGTINHQIFVNPCNRLIILILEILIVVII